MTCLQPLDNLLHVPFLTPATSPKAVGVNNAFMLSRPGHPLLQYIVDERAASKAREYPSPWLESMVTTGSTFLSNAWMKYVQTHPHRSRTDDVFVLADKHGQYKKHALGGNVETPLFKHEGANSWHTWDAPLCTFMEQHVILMIVAFAVFVALPCLMLTLGTGILLCYCCRRPRCHRPPQFKPPTRQTASERRAIIAQVLRFDSELTTPPADQQSEDSLEAGLSDRQSEQGGMEYFRGFQDGMGLPARPAVAQSSTRTGSYAYPRTSSMQPSVPDRPWSIRS